jgi:hypothetical protein
MQRLCRQRAQRQHGGVEAAAFFAVDHGNAVALGHHRLDREGNHVDVVAVGLALRQRTGDFGFKIVAVTAARHEVGAGNGRILALQKVEKSAGLAGEHAHRRGANVQQMTVGGRAIGHTARQRAAAGVPVQMQRLRRLSLQQFAEQGSGRGTAADNGDPSKHVIT